MEPTHGLDWTGLTLLLCTCQKVEKKTFLTALSSLSRSLGLVGELSLLEEPGMHTSVACNVVPKPWKYETKNVQIQYELQ